MEERVEQQTTNDIVWFQFGLLKQFEGLITHGVFARKGGVSQPPFATLNAGPTVADDPAALMENYARIRVTLPGRPRLFSAIPGHGTDMIEVTQACLDDQPTPALIMRKDLDGLLTRMRGIGLFWAVADCTTVLMLDPVHAAIGMIHAGWRGTSQAIAVKAIHMLQDLYGTHPSDLYIGLGPTIGACCYEVDEKVRAAFDAHPIAREHAHFTTIQATNRAGDTYTSLRLDIAASNHAQLLAAGVPDDHIELSGICTGDRRDLFFSNRMENSNTGRFAVVLALS
jgi:YfiH family protein